MTEKTEDKKQSVYERLSKINVKPYLKEIKKTYKDKRTGQQRSFSLSYLSWAQAWGLVKAIYPDADYKIREYPNWVRTSDGTFQQAGTLDYRITSVGCEVEVTAIIEGVNYTQKLYPMNAKNEPIPNPSINANTIVNILVYLFILFLPSSPPSFVNLSSAGITIPNN